MKKEGLFKIKIVKILNLVVLVCALSFLALYSSYGSNNVEGIEGETQASSITQNDANSLISRSTFEEIKSKLLSANDNYKTLSFEFSEWDQRFTSEKIITEASVKIVQKPLPKIKMVRHKGLLSQPKNTLEVTSDGKKTFVYFREQNLYLLHDTYINPQPGQLFPEAPPDAVIPNNNGTQIPFGADIDLAVHPELLVQNKIFNKAAVLVLGEEKIGERNALKIEIKVPDVAAEKLGDKQYYWIDTETGILLRNDISYNGTVKLSFSLNNIKLNENIDEGNFRITIPDRAKDFKTLKTK